MNTPKLTVIIIGIGKGRKANGVYYPSAGKNEKQMAARWEGKAFLKPNANNPALPLVPLSITAWNEPNGRALADIMATQVKAKTVIVGTFRIQHCLKRVFVNGLPVLTKAGDHLTTDHYSYILLDIEEGLQPKPLTTHGFGAAIVGSSPTTIPPVKKSSWSIFISSFKKFFAGK